MGSRQETERDSGWAWVILVASFYCHFCAYGLSWSTGVFHLMYLEAFEESSSVTSWAVSLMSAMTLGAGPVSSILTNRLGCRWTVIIGTLVSSFGLSMCALATNIYWIYAGLGIISGSGFGLMILPSMTINAFYFEKKRVLATGLAGSGVGIGMFLFPPLITALDQYYGWRGTMMILGALNLNMLIAGALMRPVFETHDGIEEKSKKIISMEKSEKNDDEHICTEATDSMQCYMFKDANFLWVCANNFLLCFGMSIVFVHLAAFTETKIGANQEQCAMLISALGIAGLFGRLSFAFIGQFPVVNVTFVYMISFGLSGVLTLFSPIFEEYSGLLSYAALFGLTTACFGPYLVNIIISIVGISQLNSAYGYILLFEGLGMLLGAPIAGLLYDSCLWYDASLYLGGAMIVASSVAMIQPWRSSRHQPKWLQNDEEYLINKEKIIVECMISSV